MAKGNTWSADILGLLFKATAVANIADNAASSPLTNLYVSLHTANPGAGGSQTTSEAGYTSYARVAVARSGAGFVLTGQTVNPAATITFPTATGGSETETYFAIGTASSGTGKILYSGQITSPSGGIVVSTGTIPQLTTATAVTES